jgi:hypothetical protein
MNIVRMIMTLIVVIHLIAKSTINFHLWIIFQGNLVKSIFCLTGKGLLLYLILNEQGCSQYKPERHILRIVHSLINKLGVMLKKHSAKNSY